MELNIGDYVEVEGYEGNAKRKKRKKTKIKGVLTKITLEIKPIRGKKVSCVLENRSDTARVLLPPYTDITIKSVVKIRQGLIKKGILNAF